MNWNRALYIVLALTLFGQMLVGWSYFIGQGAWLVANIITVGRDFALQRPAADKVKNICMLTVTLALLIIHLF